MFSFRLTKPLHPAGLALLLLLLFSSKVLSQASSPHIGFVYPAGGQQGTSFEIKLAGQYFAEASFVQVSGTGITTKILRQTRPLTQQEIMNLRDKLQMLTDKPKKTDEDKKEIEEIKVKLGEAAIPVSPVLGENVFVQVTIDKDAAVGPRALRLGAKTGMSNAVVFDVSQLVEVIQKKVPFDPEARPRPGLARFLKRKPTEKREAEMRITLPAVLNSQLMPGDVDHYRFRAEKGQQLVFRCRARALIPYLADAVPGWIQPVLKLYDHEGKEVAYCDDFNNKPDPVLAYKVPREGEYVLEIHDSIYRGREDFVYRIEAGELPHIAAIFPLGAQVSAPGSKTPTIVTLTGWNLPQSSLNLEPKELKAGTLQLSVSAAGTRSNSVPFQVTNTADIMEQEPNNTPAMAQKINLPIIVNGRIEKRGDVDVFSFTGRAKQTIVAEIRARRLDSVLDSYLKLTDAEGKVIAANDDFEDKAQGLITDHADSLLQATLPKEGTYYLHVRDTRGHGSPEHSYRLRVSEPRPDFELRVTPCSINARPGATVPVTVVAYRKDGFTGEINLGLKYSPLDFALTGNKIPANENEIRMTVQVPNSPRPKPIQLDIEGSATIQGLRVTRLALPAEDMMQAFAYHHLVPVEHLLVTVSKDARARFPGRLLNTQAIKIRPGGGALVRFAIPKAAAPEKLHLVLNEPPEGITLKDWTFTTGASAHEVTLQIQTDGEKVKPGLRTNLIVEVYPSAGKAGKASRFPLGTMPAFPIEILRPTP
jgi:hypothetical protein